MPHGQSLEARPLVGVIGGVGPLATAYFLERIVANTVAERDQDHVDMIVFNHAAIPDRTAFLVGRSDQDPGPVLGRDARRLQDFGADFLVMPCNTAHYFTRHILDAITIDLVSIIDVTVKTVLARVGQTRAVGLLATEGTARSGVYQQAFAAHGIEVLLPDAHGQGAVNRVIYDQVKAGLPADAAALHGVAHALAARGAGVVVLGCTELSVVAVDEDLTTHPLFIDAMDCLVRATIERAGHAVRTVARPVAGDALS